MVEGMPKRNFLFLAALFDLFEVRCDGHVTKVLQKWNGTQEGFELVMKSFQPLSPTKSIPEILRRKNLADARSREINVHIRSEIRQALDCLRWSDAELSRQSGIPPATLCRLLGGSTDSPTFDDVTIIYETLGLSLPFGGSGSPKAAVSLYIAAEDIVPHYEVPENRQTYISILPELVGKRVAEVKDDSANVLYPEGSYIFMSPLDAGTLKEKPRNVIVKCYRRAQITQVRIMSAQLDKGCKNVILESLTKNPAKKLSPFVLDIESLREKAANSPEKVEIMGVVAGAFC